MEASGIVRPTLTAEAFSISRGRKCFWEGCVASYLITYPNEDSTKVDSVCEVSLPLSLNPFGRTVEDVDLKEFVKHEATKLGEMGADLPKKDKKALKLEKKEASQMAETMEMFYGDKGRKRPRADK